MTSIQLEWWKLNESQRHNRAMENQAQSELHEATRHNVASEAIGQAQAAAAQWQARIAELRAGIEQGYLAIAQRKVPYETSLLMAQRDQSRAQTDLNRANARLADENAAYTKAKTAYQQLANGIYAMYGEDQARATYHGTVANTWNTWVDTVGKGVKTIDTTVSIVGRLTGPTKAAAQAKQMLEYYSILA